MQDIGNDVTLLHVTADSLQLGAESGASTAGRGVRAAGVLGWLRAHAEELDTHVWTAMTLGAETELDTLVLLATRLVGVTCLVVRAQESTAASAPRVHRSHAVLC